MRKLARKKKINKIENSKSAIRISRSDNHGACVKRCHTASPAETETKQTMILNKSGRRK